MFTDLVSLDYDYVEIEMSCILNIRVFVPLGFRKVVEQHFNVVTRVYINCNNVAGILLARGTVVRFERIAVSHTKSHIYRYLLFFTEMQKNNFGLFVFDWLFEDKKMRILE